MKWIFGCLLIILAMPLRGQRLDIGKEKEQPIKVDDQWEEIKSYDGKFRILSPEVMTKKIDTVETQIGQLAYHTYFFQDDLQGENLFYMLSYCDYPEYTVHSDSSELLPEFFEATMESAAASVNGELLYSDDFSYREYPGKVWRIDYLEGKALIKTRAYLIGRRYYAMQTITLKDRSLNTASDKFLDSFRFLE